MLVVPSGLTGPPVIIHILFFLLSFIECSSMLNLIVLVMFFIDCSCKYIMLCL
jgi:hypothetical protein